MLVKDVDHGVKLSPTSSFAPEAADSAEPPDSNDIRVESVDADSCEVRLCKGNGVCVMLNGRLVCDCALGYVGDSCEFKAGRLMQGPVIYATVGLAVGVLILGVIIGIIKKKKASDQRQVLLMIHSD